MEPENSEKRIPSLTEWLEKIDLPNIIEFRNEDNKKYQRLEKLNKTIGLNYNIPEKVRVNDVINETKKFQKIEKKYLSKYDKCHWRLIPNYAYTPKYRIRSSEFQKAKEWFLNLKINPSDYKHLEIIKYSDKILFSAIFVINNFGIWGEIIIGDIWQLSYGGHQAHPTIFAYSDFKNWFLSEENPELLSVISQAVKPLHIDSYKKQQELRDELKAEFTNNNFLKGYFEFIVWPDNKIMYMDYNRTIYKILKDFTYSFDAHGSDLKGFCANAGIAKGKVAIITDPTKQNIDYNDILVTKITTIDYLPLMKKAKAIITEQGNILSHASIVARELAKPCLVGVKDATKKLKNGDMILMNASQCTIKIKKRP